MNNKQSKAISKIKELAFQLIIAFYCVIAISMLAWVSKPELLYNILAERLYERHSDYNGKGIKNNINTLDSITYRIALELRDYSNTKYDSELYIIDNETKIRTPERAMMDEENTIYSEIIQGIDATNIYTMYNFVVKYERPELLGIFLNCKKQNEPYVCFRAFNQYDKLYNKGVIETVSFNGFVANEIYEMEKLRKEMKEAAEKRRIEEEEEKRLEDEKKRTKLYSCIENESGLICKKVEQ